MHVSSPGVGGAGGELTWKSPGMGISASKRGQLRAGPRKIRAALAAPPWRARVDIPPASSDPLAISAALAAIDPAALRPHSDRSNRVLHTETRIHHPVAFHGDVPEIRTVFLLRAARDVESDRLLVTSYTHAGLAFEAEDFASAMRRAVEIVPDFAIAAGLAAEGIAIVLDEYPSIDDLDLG